ncbi:PREDICTED: uncharacterized protein LOC104711473 [Camelina sativa]|uniref:Uncharacterized protein LOC104711473 n=1 Tax=Camelina sativa TaxID=90675 RepID=A0ABM0THF4_CAMSA|nr:PREDICTED: uncharacterized protein LOC104711473 [Camelina sativa]
MLTNKPRLDPTLMDEAKLMVEVELDRLFPQRIAATDKFGNVSMVDVEYSWLPKKCEKYGHLGHKETRCLILRQSNTVSILSKGSPSEVVAPVEEQTVVSPSANSTRSSQNVQIDIVSSLTHSSFISEEGPLTPTTIVHGLSPSTASLNAISLPATLASSKAAPTKTSSMIGSPPAMDTLVAFTQQGSLVTEAAQENIIGSNTFASLDTYSEMGDFTLKTRGGRSIKPTQKVQENEWTTVGRHGKRGRGGRG